MVCLKVVHNTEDRHEISLILIYSSDFLDSVRIRRKYQTVFYPFSATGPCTTAEVSKCRA
jgi:hypothetical protein